MTKDEIRRLYHTLQWRQLRLLILERDGWTCRIEPDPPHPAKTVDHIISPLIHPGAFFDESNLRAACAKHNYGRGAAMNNAARAAAYRRDQQAERPSRPSREW